MKNLDEMSSVGGGLIKSTLHDLDGEHLKCRNMLSVAEIILDNCHYNKHPNNDWITGISFLKQYWTLRLHMLGVIIMCLDVLDVGGEDVERFKRHNFLDVGPDVSVPPPDTEVIA